MKTHINGKQHGSSEFAEISMNELARVTSSEVLLNSERRSASYSGVRQDDVEERFDDEEPTGEDLELLIDDAIGMWLCCIQRDAPTCC